MASARRQKDLTGYCLSTEIDPFASELTMGNSLVGNIFPPYQRSLQ